MTLELLQRFRGTISRLPIPIRRSALEFATEDAEDTPDSDSLSASMTKRLANWVSIRFAALAHSMTPSDEDPESELRHLNELCEAVVALRRGDLHAERVLLEQKRLSLMEKHSDADLDKLFWD